jgi:hypothetical protein
MNLHMGQTWSLRIDLNSGTESETCKSEEDARRVLEQRILQHGDSIKRVTLTSPDGSVAELKWQL